MKNKIALTLLAVALAASSHVLEAGGLLGASYEDCAAAFGEPTSHDYGFGGDMYKFQKDEWEYGVVFHDRAAASILYSKIDSSPVSLTDIESIKNAYSDGLEWREQGKKLVRTDHKVYLEPTLAAVAVYTAEFRRSVR